MPIALSLVSLCIILWGLAQTDLAVAQFMRSVRLDWLDALGDGGYLLGSGWTLVGLSAVLLAVGFAAGRPALRIAGIHSLVSHGLAGLVAQLLKRLVGRPRPRLTHGDPFQFAPALESGLDSFPSGHATASFAVAAVLARSFPAGAWVFYGLAGFVAVSRVARGSHFPTDVVVGSLLGLVIGLAVAVPRGSKWRAIRESVVVFTLWSAAAFALIWVALHPLPASPPVLGRWAFSVGLAVVLGAAALHVARVTTARPAGWLPSLPVTHAAIAIGLALSTASPTVILLGALAGAALWLRGQALTPAGRADMASGENPGPSRFGLLAELALLLGLGALLFALQALQGVLPLL